MTASSLPCISVQQEAIAQAAHALHNLPNPDECGRTQVAECRHLGEDNPDRYRMWQFEDELATVTFFDEGNGWSYIHNVETKNPEDHDKFVEEVWDWILNKADNRQQNRDMLAQAQQHCQKQDNCKCAERLAATETA